MRLAPNNGLWNAFAGAPHLPGGGEPLFAEVRLTGSPATDFVENTEGWIVILDGGEGTDKSYYAVTFNNLLRDGSPVTYRRDFPKMKGRDQLAVILAFLETADAPIEGIVSHFWLLGAGFEYDGPEAPTAAKGTKLSEALRAAADLVGKKGAVTARELRELATDAERLEKLAAEAAKEAARARDLATRLCELVRPVEHAAGAAQAKKVLDACQLVENTVQRMTK